MCKFAYDQLISSLEYVYEKNEFIKGTISNKKQKNTHYIIKINYLKKLKK
jgi:hypothetical protein